MGHSPPQPSLDPRGSPDSVDAGAAPEGCGCSEGVCDRGPVAAEGVGAQAAAADVTSSAPAALLGPPPHTESAGNVTCSRISVQQDLRAAGQGRRGHTVRAHAHSTRKGLHRLWDQSFTIAADPHDEPSSAY